MYLDPEKKAEIFQTYSPEQRQDDTGSPESQIALWTTRIVHLTEHLKVHPQDNSTQLGLQRLVGKRRRMLNYLIKKDIARYRKIRDRLGLRG
jgi:small subunit ribosomal protein S15